MPPYALSDPHVLPFILITVALALALAWGGVVVAVQGFRLPLEFAPFVWLPAVMVCQDDGRNGGVVG